MSHIGKKPIEVPDSVNINIDSNSVVVNGKLGELKFLYNSRMKIEINENRIMVDRPTNQKKDCELHGLTRALINNMIIGVSKGYKKELELVGVGYTASAQSGHLLLNVGYSHPIYFEQPDGIKYETPSTTSIIITGIDKQQVGQVAAKIRSVRKPEPYKGKGIKYIDEQIRRKAGKTVGAASGA